VISRVGNRGRAAPPLPVAGEHRDLSEREQPGLFTQGVAEPGGVIHPRTLLRRVLLAQRLLLHECRAKRRLQPHLPLQVLLHLLLRSPTSPVVTLDLGVLVSSCRLLL